MKKYLLDTNICVFILRGENNLKVKIQSAGIDNCYISEITLAELYYGAECSNKPQKIRELINTFCNGIKIIPISNILEVYATQKASLRRQGKLIDDFDLLIGCTAISNNMILVTDNLKHLDRLPVTIENWVKR